MIRAFRVSEGRTVTLPQGLRAGPGRTNMRLEQGATVTLDLSGERAQFTRFVNGRKTAGDWEEIDPATVPADQDGAGAAVRNVPSPDAEPAGPMGMTMGRPTTPGPIATTRRS